jgi:hypothetical protein|tara:strand:- start:15 stop:155 length:141 start_codon:yes stop_codon:yes gene_type:complete
MKNFIAKLFGIKQCLCDPIRPSCDHANNISKRVKYCGDCKIVIDEN